MNHEINSPQPAITEFPTRRSRRVQVPVQAARPTNARESTKRQPRPNGPQPRGQRYHRMRVAVTMGLIVPGIFGTVALPAFAIPGEEVPTQVNAMLSGDVQSLTVSSVALKTAVVRDKYSATTAEELAAAAAAKAAAAAAAAAAAQAAAVKAAAQANAKESGIGTRYTESDSAQTGLYTGPAGAWQRPVSGPISSPYGPRRVICNGGGCSNGFHDGVDFSNTCGTPVRAVSAGRVTFVGSAGAYGQRVIVDHGGGVESIYGHLLSGSFRVSVGDLVSGGTNVASVGATGVVSGCHLDLKIRINGSFTNPAPFLRDRGVSM